MLKTLDATDLGMQLALTSSVYIHFVCSFSQTSTDVKEILNGGNSGDAATYL